MKYLQIFFCKYPLEGYVKTRLAKDIGNYLATKIYKEILVSIISTFPQDNVIIYLDEKSYELENEKPCFKNYFPSIPIFLQKGPDLGEKMANAFSEIYTKYPNYDFYFLTGSDIPDYNPSIIKNIPEQNEYDCFIVPSDDGGYSMIGFSNQFLKKHSLSINQLFKNIPWSTKDVFKYQLENLKKYNIDYIILEKLNDLDTYKDLLYFSHHSLLKKIIKKVYVLIPVLNEEENLKIILPLIKQNPFIKEIICIDNGSIDNSSVVAKDFNTTVLYCSKKGYGSAMLTGIEYLKSHHLNNDDIVLFMDGDGSDDPKEINKIILPLFNEECDFVLGDRTNSSHLHFHQKFGNSLATFLIKLFWDYKYHDLGPMRAIYWHRLLEFQMKDQNFGWTIEMQIKAIKHSLKIKEIAVEYKNRIHGTSKVSGTIKGSLLAGYIIIKTILKEKLHEIFKEKP